jgi:hypothetical protein
MTYKDIVKTGWLDPIQTHHLYLGLTKYPYQIFERVLLGVSASLSVNWKVLYKSKENEPLFPYLIVSLLLISDSLQEYYSFNDIEIKAIVGNAHYQLILDYQPVNNG